MAFKRRKSKMPTPPPGCPLTERRYLLKRAWTPNVLCCFREEPRWFCELSGMPDPPSAVSSRQRSKLSPAQNASSTEDRRLDHEPCFATSWLLITNLHMPTLDPVTLLSIVHSPPPASVL